MSNPEQSMLSMSVVSGVVVSPPVIRTVQAGEVMEIDVRSRSVDGSAVSVSVVVAGPLPTLAEGDTVLVVGTTRRRFFRSGAATVSRTEIAASSVYVNPDRRRRRRVLDEAIAVLSS
jgi:hypothetical protein